MSISDSLFTKQTQEYARHIGYEQKRLLFECLKSGDIAGTKEASEQFLANLHSALIPNQAENISIFRELLRYTWVQMCVVAEGGGVPEAESSGFTLPYYFALENAETMHEMIELSQRLSVEYATAIALARKKSEYSPLIQKCCDYIQSHIYENPTTQKLAEAMHFSRSYVSHKFKKELGVSINQFIMQERIHAAERVLGTDMPLSEIAENLGFASQSHFTEVFKKQTGMTPSQYRKQRRKKCPTG